MKVIVCRDFKWRLKKGELATFTKGDLIGIDKNMDIDQIILEEMCKFNYTKKFVPSKQQKKNEVSEKSEESTDFENKMVKIDYDKKKSLSSKRKRFLKKKKLNQSGEK